MQLDCQLCNIHYPVTFECLILNASKQIRRLTIELTYNINTLHILIQLHIYFLPQAGSTEAVSEKSMSMEKSEDFGARELSSEYIIHFSDVEMFCFNPR